MGSDTTRLSVEISKKEHKKLKILADANGITLRELVLAILEPVLYPQKKPNATFRKVMGETDRGEGLILCEEMQDFWGKLGLNE